MNDKLMKTAIAVLTVLMAVCFAATAITAFADGFQLFVLLGCMSYVMMFLYLAVFYKKPHDNNMKTLLLIYAVVTAVGIDSTNRVTLGKLLIPVSVVLIAYMAGRLHKLEQNKKIILIVLAIFVITTVEEIVLQANLIQTIDAISRSDHSALIKFSSYAALFGNIVQFAFCSLVYIYRYKAHIAAGINVPKEK